jgi:hypothetical protein
MSGDLVQQLRVEANASEADVIELLTRERDVLRNTGVSLLDRAETAEARIAVLERESQRLTNRGWSDAAKRLQSVADMYAQTDPVRATMYRDAAAILHAVVGIVVGAEPIAGDQAVTG